MFANGRRIGSTRRNLGEALSKSRAPFYRRAVTSVASGVRDLASTAGTAVDSAFNETIVRLAVTGLSRAGKTTFITSAIANLLALGRGYPTLAALQQVLDVDGSSRLKSVRIVPPAASSVPFFDYASKLAQLASDTPVWPSRTDDLAQIVLELDMKRPGVLGRRIGERRVRLEILDYPGEWLVDLPMMAMSYQKWSSAMLEKMGQPPRSIIFEEFVSFLRAVDLAGTADDKLIRHGHTLFKQGLHECREKFGLRYLQPGRFLCPGSRAEAPFMWFFPVAVEEDDPIRLGSTGALLRDRFEAYKADMRANFFDTHFVNFDRQIVLVDVLGALHAGKEAFDDTAQTICDIAANMSYGSNIFRPIQEVGAIAANVLTAGRASKDFSKTIRSRRIERVAFVATKADHVPALRRDNLKHLLRELASGALEHAGESRITYHVASSVLSTKDGTIADNGRPLEVVFATPLGQEQARAFYPGDVPSSRPGEQFWTNRYFEMPEFKPRKIDPSGDRGIEHLSLDEVLSAALKGVLE